MVLLERCLLLRTYLRLRWLFIQTDLRTVHFRAKPFRSIWDAWSVPSHIMMLWAPCRRRLTHSPILTVRIFVPFTSPQIRVGITIALLCSIFIGIQPSLAPLISIINFINLRTRPLLQVVPRVILQELLVVLLLVLTLLLAVLMLRQRILLACGARHTYSFELGGQDSWDVLLALVMGDLLYRVVLRVELSAWWNFEEAWSALDGVVDDTEGAVGFLCSSQTSWLSMPIKLFYILTNLKFVDVARPPMLIRVVIKRSMTTAYRNIPMRCPIHSLLYLQLPVMPQLAIIIGLSLRRQLQPPVAIPIKTSSSSHL